LVELAGRPLLDWSLDALRASQWVGPIVVAVPPGQYVVEGLPAAGLMGTPGPQNVTVAAGAATIIELSYDTGIR